MSEDPVPLPVWPHAESPFHPAELAIQERYGRRALLDAGGRRGVRGVLIEQHRRFFAQIPFLLVGSVDAAGQPWASMLAGTPGFVHSPDPGKLRIDLRPQEGDPLRKNLALGAPLGVLGIELPTRRRNRVSGRVAGVDAAGFTLEVVQSFGNCPQYIQGRALMPAPEGERPSQVLRSTRLNARDRKLLQEADSFYVASINPNSGDGVRSGADVSHRGGRPGFIRIDDDGTITVPDFVGNYFFNTIGNLMVEPRAGLLFADFQTGDLLLAAARAEVIWEGLEVEAFAGAQRLLRFHLTELIRIERGLPLRGSGVDYAPELARTGTWAEANQALEARQAASRWRPYRIIDCVGESDDVRSFILEPADGGGVAPHRAGQFLPLRLPAGAGGSLVVRTYTLSDVADGRRYRISVKREGAASAWLHEHGRPGAVIEALAPRGDFAFDEASHRPALMICAGIGVTPMMAMLNSLLVNGMRTRHPATIVFIQGARNGREHVFGEQLRHKASRHANLRLHVAYSVPDEADVLGVNHHSQGRIDEALLARLLPTPAADVYICGPAAFMQAQYDALRRLGVVDERIHCEAFGPSALRRTKPSRIESTDEHAATVVFARSGVSVRWSPQSGSLLDAAEAAGVSAPFSCRAGVCGTCATGLRSGEVAYVQEPVAPCGSGEILICCARPATTPTAVPVVLDL
jgi:ferredoxin-NADP reductase/predicted pyridoxine 5'-phosphate oxidase superfamily flavin-nucleotide-binding protein